MPPKAFANSTSNQNILLTQPQKLTYEKSVSQDHAKRQHMHSNVANPTVEGKTKMRRDSDFHSTCVGIYTEMAV